MKQTTMTPRMLLQDLYDKADGNAIYEPQPYSKWDAGYAKRVSEAFGVNVTLRAGRSKRRGATLAIITERGRRTGESTTKYEITMYENQPGNLEHEIAHYIQFAVFGSECLMDRKNYAIEEIKAESTAYVMCMMSGNETRERRTVPYIRQYMHDAGVDPRSLIPEIEARVAEFGRRGIVPPKYSPISQPNQYRYGRCRGGRVRHVFNMDGGACKCVKCGHESHSLVVRTYGERVRTVA